MFARNKYFGSWSFFMSCHFIKIFLNLSIFAAVRKFIKLIIEMFMLVIEISMLLN